MYIWRSAAFISARSLTRDPTLWLITLRCVQINYVRQWKLLPTTVFLVYLEIRVVYCCCRDANHSEEFVKCGLSFLHDIYIKSKTHELICLTASVKDFRSNVRCETETEKFINFTSISHRICRSICLKTVLYRITISSEIIVFSQTKNAFV